MVQRIKETSQMSDDQKYVLNLFKSDGIPANLDLSDDKQYNFLINLRGGQEYLETYFPHRFKLLENARKMAMEEKNSNGPIAPKHMTLLEKVAVGDDVSDWQDNIQIIGFVAQAQTVNGPQFQLNVTGLVGFVDGLEEMNATLQICNIATGQIIASNAMENLLQNGYDTVVTASGMSDSLDNIEAYLVVDYLQYNNPTPSQKMVKMTLIDKIDPSSPIQVDAPVHNKTIPKPNVGFIKVCMGRYDSDCDYSYTAQPQPLPPIPTVAVKGNVGFSGPITDPAAGGATFGAFFFVKRRQGGATQLFADYAQIYKYFTVTGNNISWNFAPATFEKAPWNQGDEVDLNLTVQISVNGIAKNAQFQVTSLVGVPASKSVAKIDVLHFFWGCLTADTMVTMQDGTQKRIDSIRLGEVVQSNNFKEGQKVMDIVTGNEENPCLKITTQSNFSIVVTDQHPICRSNGFCFAKEVKVGDFIQTQSGLEEVSNITEEKYEGIVYNLKLEGQKDTGSAHFANGVLVGDGIMQGALVKKQMEEKTKLNIEELPVHWQFDAANAKRLEQGQALIPVHSAQIEMLGF
jgi:hypothetical protein